MARVMIFQHVAAEPLGVLDPMLRRAGHRLRYVNFSRHPDARPRLERYDALVVLGGPMNVEQMGRYPHLAFETEAIRHFLEAEKPLLGICLGAQLLAHALGAEIHQRCGYEIGWYPLQPTAATGNDPVLSPLTDDHPVFQWHGRTFELPHGATRLARSAQCPNQAFRYGPQAWGFQFHLELDQGLIRRWLNTQAYLDELAASEVNRDAGTIHADTQRHIPHSLSLAESVFSNWLGRLGDRGRRIALPSR